MKSKLLEECTIALSISNLLFLKSWRRALYPSSESYHINLEPYSSDYLGVLLSVILTALILVATIRLVRLSSGGRVPVFIKLCFLGLIGIVLNGIRLQFFESEASFVVKASILLFFASAFLVIVFKWRDRIFTGAQTAVLIAAPFVLITFSQALVGTFSSNPKPEVSIKEQLTGISQSPDRTFKNRVVWIIFDDMDYFAIFGSNPPAVPMPEFQRLKSESLFAENAESPAYATVESIPSLLTGKFVRKSKPSGKSELDLTFTDGKTSRFSSEPNVLRDVLAGNGKTAVIGWYHPYCRVIGKDISACQSETFDTINDFEEQPVASIMLRSFLNCIISLPFGYRILEVVNRQISTPVLDEGYSKRHFRMIEGAGLAISDPDIDLAFIHLPFPHAPYIYNRETQTFGGGTEYRDNLALSDRVLGELRKSLEIAGLWDKTTVIVSSDHQWRQKQYQIDPASKDFTISGGIEHGNVPFLVKLTDRNAGTVYDKKFNTIISRSMINEIMLGRISTYDDLKLWLDANTANNP